VKDAWLEGAGCFEPVCGRVEDCHVKEGVSLYSRCSSQSGSFCLVSYFRIVMGLDATATQL